MFQHFYNISVFLNFAQRSNLYIKIGDSTENFQSHILLLPFGEVYDSRKATSYFFLYLQSIEGFPCEIENFPVIFHFYKNLSDVENGVLQNKKIQPNF